MTYNYPTGREPFFSDDARKKIVRLHKELTLQQIATRFSVSPSAIKRVLAKEQEGIHET